MRNDTFYCEIITQGSRETAYDFSKTIMVRVNEIMKILGVIGTPFVMPTSDANGRKEVILQWLVTADTKSRDLYEVIELQKKVIDDFCLKEYGEASPPDPIVRNALGRGYDLCIETIQNHGK